MINEYFSFRDMCSTRNINYLLEKIKGAMERSTDVDSVRAADEIASGRNSSTDGQGSSSEINLQCDSTTLDQSRTSQSQIMCITVTDTESEDEKHVSDSHKRNSETRPKRSSVKSRKISNFPIRCTFLQCKSFFENATTMMYHVTTYHAQKIIRYFECHLCRFQFSGRNALFSHMNAKHCRLRLKRPRLKKRRESLYATKDFPVVCARRNCANIFRSKCDMMSHVKNYHHAIKKTFECHLCQKTLQHFCAIRKHMKSAHLNQCRQQFKCPFTMCSIDFYRKIYRYRESHFQAKNECLLKRNAISYRNFPVKCIQMRCRNFFESEEAMRYHVTMCHVRGIRNFHECYLCKKTFTTLGSLQGHMNSKHSHGTLFECPFPTCPSVFYISNALRAHIRCLHNKSELFSTDKNEESADSNIVKDKNSGYYPIKCGKLNCKEFFQNKDAMRYHLDIYHVRGIKKTFECHLCGKTFTLRTVFENHMNSVHTRQQRFICPFTTCKMVFYQKSSIERHIKCKHSGNVASSTKVKQILKRGIDRRNRNFPVKCAWKSCKQIFDTRGAMMYHRGISHARGLKKTFECYLCKQVLYSSMVLQDHMNSVHIRQKKFECTMCSNVFYGRLMLRKHIKWVHKAQH